MTSMLAKIQQVDVEKVQSFEERERQQLLMMFCNMINCRPEQLLRLGEMDEHVRELRSECDRLRAELDKANRCSCKSSDIEKRCDNIWAVARRACCPGNLLYSQITLDEFSDNRQVNLDTPVEDFGPGYVNQFPVAPGQAIRLEHDPRPGYLPDKIAIDFSLANNGTNYLDLEITFWLGPGGKFRGKQIGPKWTGNEFLNKDGTQIHIDMPKYRGKIVEVGSSERMAVEIRHTGNANNLISAKVRLPYDEERWYAYCASLGC